MIAHLLCRRRDARHQAAFCPLNGGGVTNHENAFIIRQGEARRYGYPTCAITLYAEPFAGGGGFYTGCPDDCARRNRLLANRYRHCVDICHRIAAEDFHAFLAERGGGEGREVFGEGR